MSSRQDVRCDPLATDSCAGFTAVLHSDKAIVLSFRGTNRFLQLLVEADETVFYRKVRWSPGGHVSKYFYDAFLSVWYGGMMKEFILLRKHYPSYDVWVTGHSLGASMASLAASHIISSRYIDGNYVRLITFGQPRTGDRPFADAHDKQMYYSYRVIHGRDVVPHLPPLNLEGYYHHDSEVFYPDGMLSRDDRSYTICRASEKMRCSDGLLLTISVEDHRQYFGKIVSEYGIAGCR